MTLDRLGQPGRDCPCRTCRATRLRLWRKLTPRRRDTLRQLEFGPRTPADLAGSAHIHAATWFPISQRFDAEGSGLIDTIRLRQWTNSRGTDFLTLTQLGREVLAAGATYERATAR